MFVPSKHFQPSLMFMGKARSLPQSEAIPLDQTEMLFRDKHSNLLRKFLNYSHNKFYRIDLSGPVRKAPKFQYHRSSQTSDNISHSRLHITAIHRCLQILQTSVVHHHCMCLFNACIYFSTKCIRITFHFCFFLYCSPWPVL